MPPGWTKAVNSKTLMDSFAKVDKLLKGGNKKSKICGNCSEYLTKEDDKKTKMIVDVLENINCHDYSQDQLAKILVGLTQLIQTGRGDLPIMNNDQTWSALSCSQCSQCSCSPSLLHFSPTDLLSLCSPSLRALES